MAKTLVILNPTAASGRAARLWPRVEAALRDGGLNFDLERTASARRAIRIAETAARAGCEMVVAAGGDGVVHEVVNGLMRAAASDRTNTALGVIPLGSGNDYAGLIPLASGDWQGAAQKILAGHSRWFDVGKVTADMPADDGACERYFANTFDTGFGAEVCRCASGSRLTGRARYFLGIFKALVRHSAPRLIVRLPDRVIEQRSSITVAAIGRCFGSGFKIAPNAVMDDGLLDVLIADGLGRMGILSLLPKVVKGSHTSDPRVKCLRAPRLGIESPDPLAVECDGEMPWADAHRLEIELLPKRLRVIV